MRYIGIVMNSLIIVNNDSLYMMDLFRFYYML